MSILEVIKSLFFCPHVSSNLSKYFIISTLCGIVTLNPSILIFLSASTPSSNSPFVILYAIYEQSKFNSLKAALWMLGDNEWSIGSPITANVFDILFSKLLWLI